MSNLTVEQAVKIAAQTLSKIPDPYFEAECLLASVLNVDRLFLKKNPTFLLDASVQKMLNSRVLARQEGSPLAYIIGKKAFWTFDLKVTPAVLIPRADTERLVEAVLEKLPEDLPYPVLELGTGSGAIALALASERPKWKIIATDRSDSALTVAKENAALLKKTNIRFCRGTWFEAVKGEGPFAAVVSNPPYIAKSDPHLQQSALQAEPYDALCSGETGLEAFTLIIENAKKYLVNEGLLCLEHGHDQSQALRLLLEKNGYHEQEQFFDLGNIPRVITAKRLL